MEKNKLKHLFRKKVDKNLRQRTDNHCMHLQSEEEITIPKTAKVVQCHFKNQFIFKSWDRELKEETYQNPYTLPDHMRVATKPVAYKKVKPIDYAMEELRTVADPQFYELVEGRPIRNFTDVKVYMKNIRNMFMFRADAAYLMDQFLQLEKEIYEENEDFDKVIDMLTCIKSSFMKFAAESYAEAKHVQDKAEKKARELAATIDEFEGLNFRFVELKNKVADIFLIHENLMRYQHFLYSVSPIMWKERHLSLSVLSPTLSSNLFHELVSEGSVTLFKNAAAALTRIKAPIYFETPQKLISVLDTMAQQCVNYIEINSVFAVNLEKLQQQKRIFQKRVKEDCSFVQEVIEMFKRKVTQAEESKDDYEAAFYAILENKFYQLYASFEPIKLFTCVQFVHHQLFEVVEDPKDDLCTLMGDIEIFYNTINKQLEALDTKVVHDTAARMFADDINRMKLAADAQRELKAYEATCRAFYRAFEPPKFRSCLTKVPGK